MRFFPAIFLAGITVLAGPLLSRAAEWPAVTPEAREFFETKIRPVLVAECTECHNGAKHKGGLRLDYRDGWKKGGDSGDAILPGDAAHSLLIKSIRHEDPDLKMPAKSPKLEDTVIADFEKWVNMGAPDPRDQPPPAQTGKPQWADLLAVRRAWWSLQPVHKPALPIVHETAWSAHPLDRFLLAKMEEHHLKPAPDADPRLVIRRLSFTLTGLPPTPADVDAFVAEYAGDPRQAVEKAADRLLASPRFGEHWARHWLDLVRYAETHGSEGDPEVPQAWRFRDYMIRALNDDVPIDQLIREQLAGDLLAHPRINSAGIDESILGTAQLRFVEHGFQPVDTLDDQVKAVDNQIDVVSKAFQGLTIACARCHDHKFDAISQRDYYALYGIFASCRPAQVIIDAPAVQEKNRAALESLHGQIKFGLAAAWLQAAGEFGSRLEQASANAAAVEKRAARIHELEQAIHDVEWNARRSLAAPKAAGETSPNLPAPFAAWNFQQDARDSAGHLDGHLEGGAEVRGGRLVLDGKGAYFRTDALPIDLGAKTLMAWVTPSTLDQRGGGVLTIESTDVHGFDSIVFGEMEPRHWHAGSNNSVRSQPVGGPEENAPAGELIQVAIVYSADNSITLYRDGAPYGQPYTKSTLRQFAAGNARVLIGLRHKGAGRGFFAGEVAEARVYDRALTPAQVADVFHAGPAPSMTPEQITAALTPAQRARRTALAEELDTLRATVSTSENDWTKAYADAAKDPANPLHLWTVLSKTSDATFPESWNRFVAASKAEFDRARKSNQEKFHPEWDLAGADYAKWFPYGPGCPPQALPSGQFTVATEGDRILDGLYPGGALTDRLSEKHTGILTSPRFKITSDNISVRAFGSGGAMVRVIVDNYPLPSNPIFPKAILEKNEPGWVRLDTAYRKGSEAYIEFATREDLTRPLQDKKQKAKGKPDDDEPSRFGVDQIVFHDGPQLPEAETSAVAPFLDLPPPASAAELENDFAKVITDAITAWQKDALTEGERLVLDSLVRRGLLPTTLGDLETLRPLVAEYRRLESEEPPLHHAPGVLETAGADAPFLPRGDYLKPGELVPRAYLGVFGGQPYRTPLSGRRELAEAIAGPQNPLTARVMANRIWHWTFGRGIVSTVDNFGRLGEKPTHAELLEYLAARLVENGWSLKRTVRDLVTTRAFGLSSEPSAAALESDPSNDWLSHMRVRRLEAESIRDSLLAISGELQETMFGPPADINGTRRSIYLPVRRTSLNPFLQVFDAPKPFTTLGRRDATNVPAQSLAMLNSPFVIERAARWASALLRDESSASPSPMPARIGRMFTEAFGRPPSPEELTASGEYVEALARDRHLSAEQISTNLPVWQDFAQSLFNLKEFIYVR